MPSPRMRGETASAMPRPDTRVRIAFDLAAGGVGDFFTLNDPTKGALNNATFKLAGDILEDVTDDVRSVTVRRGFFEVKTAGIFIAVKMGLERTVQPFKERFDLLLIAAPWGEPILRIILFQRPKHDIAAFFQNLAITALQNRHRRLCRGGPERLRLVPQQDFTKLNLDATDSNCQTCPHCIGAAAETPEDMCHATCHLYPAFRCSVMTRSAPLTA